MEKLTTNEVIARRGLSRQRINALINEGRLTPTKAANGRNLFDVAEVEALQINPHGVIRGPRRTRAQIVNAAMG